MALIAGMLFAGQNEALYAVSVDGKHRRVTFELPVLDQGEPAIVEEKPASVQPRSDHGVIFSCRGVADEQEPKVFVRKPGLLERDIFGNRIVFAIARAGSERLDRRGPKVGNSVLSEIAHGADREIDGAIHRPDSRTPFARTAAAALWYGYHIMHLVLTI